MNSNSSPKYNFETKYKGYLLERLIKKEVKPVVNKSSLYNKIFSNSNSSHFPYSISSSLFFH